MSAVHFRFPWISKTGTVPRSQGRMEMGQYLLAAQGNLGAALYSRKLLRSAMRIAMRIMTLAAVGQSFLHVRME
jgi:hypothetical protein